MIMFVRNGTLLTDTIGGRWDRRVTNGLIKAIAGLTEFAAHLLVPDDAGSFWLLASQVELVPRSGSGAGDALPATHFLKPQSYGRILNVACGQVRGATRQHPGLDERYSADMGGVPLVHFDVAD